MVMDADIITRIMRKKKENEDFKKGLEDIKEITDKYNVFVHDHIVVKMERIHKIATELLKEGEKDE